MRKHMKQMLIPFATAALAMGTAMVSYAATGWQQEDGNWYYYNNDGDRVTDEWKKSGNDWFWLDEDGNLATDELVEYNDNFYYVNEAGARVSNEWHKLEDEDGEEAWYYFGSTGKAYKAGSTGKTTFKSITNAEGVTKKYAFDSEGRMLYGWVNDQSENLDDDDAWRTGTYYLGSEDDGAMRNSEWVKLEVEDDTIDADDFDGTHWFYFGSNGKKTSDTTKKINGKTYRFEEDGNAVFNWYVKEDELASSSNLYYNLPTQCWQASGWFYSVPGEDVDAEGYENGDEYWFYAQKDGELVKSQIKKIDGYYYGFNEYGEMLEGLYKLSINDDEIQSYEKIESADDLPSADEAWEVYYFGNEPKDGVLKTGKVTIDLDGDDYTFNFKKTTSERGMGYNGINDGMIYIKGRLLKAEKDAKLEVVTYDGNDYLVNTSGKIQKNKTNVKDADDYYYCTDSEGIVTYKGAEKNDAK